MKATAKHHCGWSRADDDTDMWESECGNAFCFNDGGPMENGFTHCPYCGKPIDADSVATPAQEPPLPALPKGWRYYPREDAWARTSHPERPGQRYASVSLNDEGVVIEGDISPADLITVLHHAEAAHQRLKEGQ